MKRNTKREVFEEDSQPEQIELCAVDLSDMIEAKLENRGKGRTSIIFKNEVNDLIDQFNSKYGKIYNRIK